jgi:hypothetical protein
MPCHIWGREGATWVEGPKVDRLHPGEGSAESYIDQYEMAGSTKNDFPVPIKVQGRNLF